MKNMEEVKLEKQNDANATYASKLKKEDGLINWNEPALKIHNKIRGFIPWPGAYTYYDGKILKVLKTEIVTSSEERADDGEVIDIAEGKGIVVRTGLGNLAIQYLQLEGKKVLDSDSFVRGHKITRGYKFASKRANPFQ